ncbi:rSAM-modified peptide [Flavobacterium sp. MC2016-06]|jgi:natural product precursor|nr:rSAM-modified peptide [Flavobacterium sp. MC2016-06]MBU3859576.1 rSAM-modified peptide [Flavobacterium sp. MC2016-06]
MKSTTLKFEDFKNQELSKKQQKTVRGGDDGTDPTNDPGKKTGTGNG